MKNGATILAISVLVTLGAGPAAVAQQQPACFHTSAIGGWTYIDRETIRVSAGPSKYLDLKLMGNAQDLNLTQTLAIKGNPDGLICEGKGLGLEVLAGGPVPRKWPIIGVTLVKKP